MDRDGNVHHVGTPCGHTTRPPHCCPYPRSPPPLLPRSPHALPPPLPGMTLWLPSGVRRTRTGRAPAATHIATRKTSSTRRPRCVLGVYCITRRPRCVLRVLAFYLPWPDALPPALACCRRPPCNVRRRARICTRLRSCCPPCRMRQGRRLGASTTPLRRTGG